VLIFKFLVYFGVNLDGDLFEVNKGRYEITNVTLHKMSFTKVDDNWMSKDNE